MARLLTQVLGTMSGSVGDIVFRRRGGRSYVSAHPSGYTPRTDAATVARKKQFKTAVEIAKNINSIPLLKADRKSTRLNSSHLVISYADFCVKKKKKTLSDEESPSVYVATDIDCECLLVH